MSMPSDPADPKSPAADSTAPPEGGTGTAGEPALPPESAGVTPELPNPQEPLVARVEGFSVASASPDSLGAMVVSAPGGSAGVASAVSTLGADEAVGGGGAGGSAEPTEAQPSAEAGHAGARPSFVFFGIVSALSLLADVGSKAWAEIELGKRTLLDPAVVLIDDHLKLTLAFNRGGAWGLLQDAHDSVRRPFFLVVSLLAIAFIVSLYGRLVHGQGALKWGLPLVLGGALGNLSDRIVRNSVIDFVDYRADWVRWMNDLIAKGWPSWTVTDHWPTFNVADISICVGVGLMAIDMFTSRRSPKTAPGPVPDAAGAVATGGETPGAGEDAAQPGPTAAANGADEAPPTQVSPSSSGSGAGIGSNPPGGASS